MPIELEDKPVGDWLEAKMKAELARFQEIRNSDRYLALKEILEFHLGGYQCESGRFEDATSSDWSLRSKFVFLGTNKPPESIDAAIDEWMKRRDHEAGQAE